MKKTIKILLIVLIIIAIIIGGLFGWYKFNQGKKVAKVAPLSNIGMDSYWGDSIDSYGEVTADKSQMGYLPQGAEVLSVNVKEGDHVEEGDVIISVKKETKDINNKKLEISKANHELNVQNLKLKRLMDTEPVPTYVYSQEVYKDYNYTEKREYYDSNDKLVAEELFDIHGNSIGFSGINYDENNEKIIFDITDKDKIAARKENTHTKDISGVYSYHRSTTYFDYDTGKVVGETNYTIDGEVENEKKVPEGMNAKELSEAIENVKTEIVKQDLNLRKLNYELQTMQNTTDDGQVVAKVSGTVSKLQDIENYSTSKPFFVITATDEYFISGSIGEFYLDQVKIGDTVSISSWDTGASAEAVITSVSDTPQADGGNFWSGSGNSNSSNYEFKASFDKNSGIDIGSGVQISITPSGKAENALFIPNYVVRKDNGGSYVMKRNDDGVLEKTYIKIGRSIWGDQIEVKEGITIDDYVSFPYGDGAIEGVKCEEVEYLGDDGGLG